MSIDNTKVVNLNIKKEDRLLDFSDFQKQNIKFDVSKFKKRIIKLFKLENLMMVVV